MCREELSGERQEKKSVEVSVGLRLPLHMVYSRRS
jgi:hypothetical protein